MNAVDLRQARLREIAARYPDPSRITILPLKDRELGLAAGTRATVASLPPIHRRMPLWLSVLLIAIMALGAWAPILFVLWLVFR